MVKLNKINKINKMSRVNMSRNMKEILRFIFYCIVPIPIFNFGLYIKYLETHPESEDTIDKLRGGFIFPSLIILVIVPIISLTILLHIFK